MPGDILGAVKFAWGTLPVSDMGPLGTLVILVVVVLISYPSAERTMAIVFTVPNQWFETANVVAPTSNEVGSADSHFQRRAMLHPSCVRSSNKL